MTTAKKTASRKTAKDKRPVSETVKFCLDSEAQDRFDRATDYVERARRAHERALNGDNPIEQGRTLEALVEAETELTAAELAFDAEVFAVRLASISRKRYVALITDYPATPEQIAAALVEYEKMGALDGLTESQRKAVAPATDTDRFPRALVEACADPPLSEEDLDAIFDPDGNWSMEDVRTLFQAAERVCTKASILRR